MCDFLKGECGDVRIEDLSTLDKYITSVQEKKREIVFDVLPY
jgi:hypothetical protein